MITYQEESVRVIFDEGAELLNAHYKELAKNQDKINLDPDIDTYLHLEKVGKLVIITVRDSNVLVGYTAYAVTPAPHYKGSIYAVNDVIFLDQEYRGSGIGNMLLTYSEAVLKQKGVDVVWMTSKLETALDELLPSIGYTHVENNYSKYIGGDE